MKRIFLLFCGLAISTCTFGFRPVGHIVLQRTIAQRLPPDNIFRKAMEAHPTMAAWGSLGPDLAYSPDLGMKRSFERTMARDNNYADIGHYYKTGTFCKALVDSAVSSGNPELIAFAAGWLTHVAGDFGSHQFFVYPEAGYYIENHSGRELHGNLEQLAESVIFEKGAILPNGTFYVDENLDPGVLMKNFFGMSPSTKAAASLDRVKIKEFLRKVFYSVYSYSYDLNTDYIMTRYGRAFGSLPGRAAGFVIENSDSSKRKLGLIKLKNLDSAFNYSVTYGQKLLQTCLENNYKEFSDKWNLDIGPNAKTLVIKLTIDDNFASGSKNKLFINLKLKTAVSAQLNYQLKYLKVVKYKKNDILYGYVALNDCNVELNRIYSFFISKQGKLMDQTRIKSLVIENNGVTVFQSNEPFVLRYRDQEKEFVFSKYLNN